MNQAATLQEPQSAQKPALSLATHLGVASKINLGSFYTPAKYVRLVAEWLRAHGIPENAVVADVAAGYGAFFELSSMEGLDKCRFVANDIDHVAVLKGSSYFPRVEWHEGNALVDVSRIRYGIGEHEHLVIVGNPPYNDVTSEINHGVKTASRVCEIDSDIATRDLGMSFLNSYDKLKADHVAVLHPLSYLIKRSNYSSCRRFFRNYRMIEHLVFSSQEFAGTSRLSAFPVVVALYERAPFRGLSYEEIRMFKFKTAEEATFSINSFDYVTDYVDKYPGNGRFNPEILFYTLRDINALKRSRTFLPERIPNAVDVNPEKFAYYCYIDCFKRYANVPYYMGNFNIPFDKATFDELSYDFVKDATYNHPEVFGHLAPPSPAAVAGIKEFIRRSINR